MTALCSGKICTIFPEKGALNFWKACTIALEYSYGIKIRFLPMNSLKSNDKLQTINLDDLSEVMKDMKNITTVDCPI